MPLPVQLIRKYIRSGSACGAIMFMQVPLLNSIVEYDAGVDAAEPTQGRPRYYHRGTVSGPIRRRGVLVHQRRSQYYGIVYKVPKGFGAWLLGAGRRPRALYQPGAGRRSSMGVDRSSRPVGQGNAARVGRPARRGRKRAGQLSRRRGHHLRRGGRLRFRAPARGPAPSRRSSRRERRPPPNSRSSPSAPRTSTTSTSKSRGGR